MIKFKRHKQFAEVLALCKAQKVPVNAKMYIEQGYDTIVVGQPWPLNQKKAYVVYNTCNGKFWGKTDVGLEVSSCSDQHDAEPWMQSLLGFFMTNQPLKSAAD